MGEHTHAVHSLHMLTAPGGSPGVSVGSRTVLQSHALLLQLGQQPEIAVLASRYLILCIPCLFLTTTMECLRKYLQSQRAVKPAMVVAGAVLAASPLFFWLLVEQCQMGLDGAAFAFIACQVTTLLGLLGYVVYRAWRLQGKREQTWGGWSREAFQGWGEYCSYGLPAAAMIAGEWWAYEVGCCLCGFVLGEGVVVCHVQRCAVDMTMKMSALAAQAINQCADTPVCTCILTPVLLGHALHRSSS